MSKIKRLVDSYGRFIALPWRGDAAAAQRVVFCVYPETEELRLRANLGEFELTTHQAGHDWASFDLTSTFAEWMAEQEYADAFFTMPQQLKMIDHHYLDWLEERFVSVIGEMAVEKNHVMALYGVGSLFGLLKVKAVVDRFAPHVLGRLVVLFPGSFDNNNYRLLDGYDGWNYLATPITPDGAH
ncbi:BREX protein BrxB domain-containing protein [Halomonas sp. Bachu 37]|uniref:BREX protein BrxB domain-containing protein n=1 Tax=Halomonas kashgarensis TaxID=3084920 RepID=UPI0032168206